MTTISERLRHLKSLNNPEMGGPYGGYAAEQCMVAMGEAADTIDALVEALEPIAASQRGLEITIAQLDACRAALAKAKGKQDT